VGPDQRDQAPQGPDDEDALAAAYPGPADPVEAARDAASQLLVHDPADESREELRGDEEQEGERGSGERGGEVQVLAERLSEGRRGEAREEDPAHETEKPEGLADEAAHRSEDGEEDDERRAEEVEYHRMPRPFGLRPSRAKPASSPMLRPFGLRPSRAKPASSLTAPMRRSSRASPPRQPSPCSSRWRARTSAPS